MILLPTLPSRIAFTPPSSPSITYLGTILYAGSIPPTPGIWFGVEWDDPSRGKHGGVHEGTGVRYFSCRVEGAGSFIRPHAAGLSFGRSFRQAVRNKYLEENGGEGEASTFYTTSSNFEVEVVSLAKVRDKFRQLGRLRDVGLEWEGVNGAGSVEEREAAGKELERNELLNLSYSLIPSFEALAEISGCLSTLRSLYANSNRFAPLAEPTALPGFAHLTSLHLNKTLVPWDEMLLLSPSLPALKELQLGSNLLSSLAPPPHPPTDPFPALESLNLHANLLNSWPDLVASLAPLPSLKRLILSSNRLSSIPSLSPNAPTLRTLRHLSLANNALQSWADVDALNSLPSLEGIWIGENPLFEGLGEEKGALFLLARIERLSVLEGTKITPTQKEDAELFYISCVGKEDLRAEERGSRHPRYLELLRKYGQSLPAAKKVPTLKSKLIRLRITSDLSTEPSTLSVLPTLSTRLLRTHLSRLLKQPLPASQFQLVALLQPNAVDEDADRPRVEIPSSEEGRQVAWWGLLDGDEVRVERV